MQAYIMTLAAMYETAWKRVAAAAITTPTAGDWVQVACIMVATCAISLPIGLQSSAFHQPAYIPA